MASQSHKEQASLKDGRWLANPAPEDRVVISGIGGSYPQSESAQKLRDNLHNKTDILTDFPDRDNNPRLPKRYGKLKTLNKFDSEYFNVSELEAECMDPMIRISLEKTYEAIVDAGINPEELHGKNIGVYVGLSITENERAWFFDKVELNGYAITGNGHGMLAHHISYFFGFTGPSEMIDSACSSSLYSLSQAFEDIRDGRCEAAVVGGCHLLLAPTVSMDFKNLGILSDDGIPRPFDEGANGYVRGEAIAMVLLQKSKDARRIYGSIVHCKSNCDGYKSEGISFPSPVLQQKLMNDLYEEADLDPREVTYVEAHGTGTKVGDPEELRAISEVFCTNRDDPLLIGSIKSNVGHSEACAGIVGLIKVAFCMDMDNIYPNLNFETPRQVVPYLVNGKIKVVTENTHWPSGLAAVSSFGFGGANAHIVLNRNSKNKLNEGKPFDNIPRLVITSGRTLEAVRSILDDVEAHPVDAEFINLLHRVNAYINPKHAYRGYILLTPGDKPRNISHCDQEQHPLWFVFSGLGSQWPGMGNALLEIPAFIAAVEKCDNVLKSKGVNIHKILTEEDPHTFDSILNCFVGIVTMQIGLLDVLTTIGIKPDGIIGHSVGELACAYADGSLTIEQAVLAAYYYGLVFMESSHTEGAMASIALSHQVVQKICPSKIQIACKNGPNSCTISGLKQDVKRLVQELQEKGTEVKWISCGNVACHSQNITYVKNKLLHYLSEVISSPKTHSENWISSSVSTAKHNLPSVKLSSAEYFTNVLLSPVLFEEARQLIPTNAFTVEISPDSVLDDLQMVLCQKGTDSSVSLLTSLGILYQKGTAMDLSKFYPAIQYPVSRGTPMISHLIKWEHSRNFYVPHFEDGNKSASCSKTFEIDVTKAEEEFYTGHAIDGRNLFPATGYVALVWQAWAEMHGVKRAGDCSVHFENVRFNRATNIPKDGNVVLKVTIHAGSGKFAVHESGAAIVTGSVGFLKSEDKLDMQLLEENEERDEVLELSTKDIYKELKLRGYFYKGLFRGLDRVHNSGSRGYVKWCDNWVSFMDNILQIKIISLDSRGISVPTEIDEIVIDVDEQDKCIKSLGDSKLLPVYSSKNINFLHSGGVYIRGLIANPIARRKTLTEAVLEKYLFMPHCSTLEPDFTLQQVMTLCIHLLLENNSEKVLKGAELLHDLSDPGAELLSPLVLEVVGRLPVMQANMKIVAKPNDPQLSKVPPEIEVDHERLTAGHHIVLATNILANKNELIHALDSLTNTGCIITREKKDTLIFESDLGLDIMMDYTLKKERIIMLKKKCEEASLVDQTEVVHITEKNFDWLPLLQQAMESQRKQRVLLVAQGEPLNGIMGLYNCLHREPNGENVRCFFILDCDAPEFNPMLPFYRKQLEKDLAVNVLKNGHWGSFRHLPLDELPSISAAHSFSNTDTVGDLSSLTWFEGPLDPYRLQAKKGPQFIHIYYSAMNFRDVMVASGRLSLEVVCPSRIDQNCAQGIEFSGRTTDGKRVMGLISGGAIANIVRADKCLLWNIPDEWTLEEAATVPTVYATVLFAILITGRLKKGESILIHAGSGGVGQAAINVALYYGLTVFTTVSSQEKRDFIKQQFPQVLDKNIGNSRDTTFEQMIMEQTKGRGVDLVLNSLSEEKLQASVRCLAVGGRFLEIGKFDMANNNKLHMEDFLKGISFHSIVLDRMFNEGDTMRDLLIKTLQDGVDNGSVRPLARTVYREDEVEEAYRYMASGKHVGKVLINLRPEEAQRTITPLLKTMQARPRFYCDPELHYIILGGLGGFGLELADWMILRGARYLTLTSRRGITNGYQSYRVRIWKSYGAKIQVSTEDISTEDGVRKLLASANSIAPIGGIFNLAVALSDAILMNQTQQSFIESHKGKAMAARHLDKLTRQMCPKLKHFVMFSSVSCGRGNPGQTNYGMSNSVMERICEARVQDGLPGLAVQWGAVGDVGLVAELLDDNIEFVIGGTLLQKISSCLQALDSFLRQQQPIVESMVVAEKLSSGSSANILESVLNILGIRERTKISPMASLPDMGMDSMSGVEIKQTLERDFQIFLTPREIRELTIQKLKELSEISGIKVEDEIGSTQLANVEETALLKMFQRVDLECPTSYLHPSLPGAPSRKIILIPGVEMLGVEIEPLAQQLNAQTIILQHTKELPGPTINDMVEMFMPVVKEQLLPGEPFMLIGFSYGGLLSMEITARLEAEGLHGKLVLIDSSPDYLMESTAQVFSNKMEGQLYCVFHILHELKITNASNIKHYRDECMKLTTLDEQVEWAVNMINSKVKITKKLVKQVILSSYTLCNYITAFKWKHPKLLKTPVLLIAPTKKIMNTEADYGLSKYFETIAGVYNVEGDHSSVLKHADVSTYINHFLDDTNMVSLMKE